MPRFALDRTTTTVGVAVLALAGGIAIGGTGAVSASPPAEPKVQNSFDSLGADVRAAKLPSGRTAHYTDSGPADGTPVLYIGGTGTSARAVHMTDFFRTTRQDLGLRMITVERNGFGDTDYDPKLGAADYAEDALEVLDRLGVEHFKVVAISGGGPYAAQIASRAPERVSALHLAAALPPYGDRPAYCALTDDRLRAAVEDQIKDPRVWWAFPDDSPVHAIPGFADTAYEDGARTYNQRGQQADPAPQVHEQRLYCDRPGPDVSKLGAPVFLYHGDKDTTVPASTLAAWRSAFTGTTVKTRTYADSAHDVQYRHWDQILVDLAGRSDRTVVCLSRRTRALPAAEADALVAKDRATLGSCAWND
ncbi:alpha/beta hydrolase [Streptomyces sp. Q6]|uniref:Alpha/beta hydrolase n=1 Tax=Streptomyces citrinus TaxID=3118173 RepID=A0ACD5AHL2_9ACTN